MKKFIAIAFIAVVATVLASSGASADKIFSPTCPTGGHNGVNTPGTPEWTQSGAWILSIRGDCAPGDSVEWELQHSSDGGSTWNDVNENGGGTIDHMITNWMNGDAPYTRTPISVAACNVNLLYRVHEWGNGNNKTSAAIHPC